MLHMAATLTKTKLRANEFEDKVRQGRTPQHDGLAKRKAEKVPVLSAILPEVTALKVQRVAKCHGALAGTFIAGVVGQHDVLNKVSRYVGESDLHWVDHDKAPLRLSIQLLAAALLQHIHRRPNLASSPGDSNNVTERVQSLRGVASAPQTVESGHAGIIPAGGDACNAEADERKLTDKNDASGCDVEHERNLRCTANSACACS
jgi:hypothetical protein